MRGLVRRALRSVCHAERVCPNMRANPKMLETKATSTAGEGGQGMVEYVILLFTCMLGLLAILAPMCHGIHVYMKSIYFCVSLPYP